MSKEEERQCYFNDCKSFCESFWHMDKVYEWSRFKPVCLDPPKFVENVSGAEDDTRCRRWIVNAIVELYDITIDSFGIQSKRCIFSKRYTNEFKGNTNLNTHAEELICLDSELSRILSSSCTSDFPKATRTEMIIYLGYQPCHHSGGGRNYAQHMKSCSNVLSQWYQQMALELSQKQEKTFSLIIKCCSLYRVHWDDRSFFKSNDLKVFDVKVNSALQGMLICKRAGIQFQAMNRNDWTNFLNKYSQRNSNIELSISNELWQSRDEYDRLIDHFLKKQLNQLS